MMRIEHLGSAAGRMRSMIGLAAVSLVLAACSTAGSGSTSATASASASSAAESASASASESASASAGGAATVTLANSSLGQILTDGAGRTIYRFTPDSANTSSCTGGCLDNWPPLTVPSGETPTAGDGVTGDLGTITRDDGSTQVTVNGFPVYYFAGDAAAGDVNGQGVGGKWFVITADGEMHQ
jgi:predicted lipoprotein with Yx(FWY)xxD motif